PGYVVSQIRADGYLRVRQVSGRRSRRFHRDREGHPVRILTRQGPVPGVVLVNSVHLSNSRPEVLGEEHIYIDVGASSPAEAAALGIQRLDPLSYREIVVMANGQVSGPVMGQRAGIWALWQLLGETAQQPQSERLVFAFVAQSRVGGRPLGRGGSGVLRRLKPEQILMLSAGEDQEAAAEGPRKVGRESSPWQALSLRVRHDGSSVETVSLKDLQEFQRALRRELPGNEGSETPQVLLRPRIHIPSSGKGRPPHLKSAPLLERLVWARGVSGHEEPVREVIAEEIARLGKDFGTQIDEQGNLLVTVGEGNRTLLFIAHMDEVGLEVTAIREDGLLETRRRGGFLRHLYRATAVEVTTSRGLLPGVTLPGTADEPRRSPILIDVGARSLEEAEGLGVGVGDAATDPKQLLRLGAHRVAGRSLDDRVGCAALLLALGRIDTEKLAHRVVFAWVTREEIGLEGADYLARTLRPLPSTVFAVDTYVTADSPREDPRFAHVPLAGGPVLRAFDSSSVAPRSALDKVREIATRQGLPLQIGTMIGGGNDGSRFVLEGAVNCPLAWPQRCSHSRVETMDLRDLEQLAQLIAAIAVEY
ncbi:MAG: M28 family peptidase, partial [Planctomycetota bacterium]